MEKVLITGIAGLLGSHLSRYLLDKGYDVVGIDNFFGGYKEFVDPRVRLYVGDLETLELTDSVFNKERPDYVYHMAAYAAEGLSPFIRHFNYTNNILASANVITSCIKYDVKKLISCSSMSVYGNSQPPFIETMQQAPIDPYAVAKYAVEMDIKIAHDQHGLNYTIVRPHNVVGVYQNIWDKYRNVIGIWIRKIINKEPLLVYGDGTQRRAFSDIKFYMEPFHKLITGHGNGEIINIGADQDWDLNTVSSMLMDVSKEFGFNPDREYKEKRHEVHTAYCNHDKAKTLLGFNDETNLEQTMKEMLGWAINQPEREVKLMKYELEKGIYSFWK